MKHNTKTRLISWLMIVVMLLGYMPATAWAVDVSTDIQAIEKPTGISIVEDYDDYVGDNWEAGLGLPTTVKVTLANGSTANAAVAWDTSALDTRKTGYYSIPGEVTLPNGATNGKNLKANITIQVREYANIIGNGDFENGTAGWKGWSLASANDPKNASNKVLFGKTSAIKTTAGGGQIIYQKDDTTIAALVNAFAQYGGGQYYFAVDAMSAPYDASNPALSDMKVWLDLRYNTNGSGTGTSSAGTSAQTPVNATEWTTTSTIITMQDSWNWLRTDVKARGTEAVPAGVYLDNFQLVPLKVALKAEPAAITAIKTQLLSRRMVLNYPDYVLCGAGDRF